ncbi:hypothetical protein [Paenibacillus riograndensis]|uniref:Uncharacterized protein n=1 Tax=Paenibacillus riograndensis SBR5 TaxID=1073571 RepID=A0A0E4CXJ3_9BACL|nr:hypothetical protein [Paenibacillus riograndensis]CQR56449.1 hypothetical protein PRIO_4046 [Paenibacillus riograndensis SBR5]
MSLKPVELQIAVPRTTEAGKIQNGLQHRPALDQQQLAGQNVKQTEQLAQRSSEVDESAEPALRDHGGGGQQPGSHSAPPKPQKTETAHDAEHPYKGHRIDLSL